MHDLDGVRVDVRFHGRWTSSRSYFVWVLRCVSGLVIALSFESPYFPRQGCMYSLAAAAV